MKDELDRLLAADYRAGPAPVVTADDILDTIRRHTRPTHMALVPPNQVDAVRALVAAERLRVTVVASPYVPTDRVCLFKLPDDERPATVNEHPLYPWLDEQLAYDELAAQAATAGPWRHNPNKQWHDGHDFDTLKNGQEFVAYGGPSPFVGCVAATGPADDPQSMADAAHIALHDPERVLRDVAAHRAILDRHRRTVHFDQVLMCRKCGNSIAPCGDIRLIAAVYADRPGYDPDWAPRP